MARLPVKKRPPPALAPNGGPDDPMLIFRGSTKAPKPTSFATPQDLANSKKRQAIRKYPTTTI